MEMEISSDLVQYFHIKNFMESLLTKKYYWIIILPIYRKYRCGIGKNRCGIGISDVVSEKTDVVSVFPMWYRNFPATCLFRYHIGNYF
jgi:hypothetical protein